MKPSTSSPDPHASRVELCRVDKSFREGSGSRAVLCGLDFALQPGEFVAVTGRSGSGKSTLLNLIAGLERADSGEVWVDGRELGRASDAERARLRCRGLGLVYQFFNLLPTLTLLENLLLPLELAGRLDRHGPARARELLGQVGLAGREASFPDRLSGGEAQRAAIARALVHQPAIVLADEPTGNLDDENARAVIELFVALVRERRASLCLVTHSREFARRADRELALIDGRLCDPRRPTP